MACLPQRTDQNPDLTCLRALHELRDDLDAGVDGPVEGALPAAGGRTLGLGFAWKAGENLESS